MRDSGYKSDLHSYNLPLQFSVYLQYFNVDLKREDNGNYSCEVRGQTSRVLANVTHTVVVRGKIKNKQ